MYRHRTHRTHRTHRCFEQRNRAQNAPEIAHRTRLSQKAVHSGRDEDEDDDEDDDEDADGDVDDVGSIKTYINTCKTYIELISKLIIQLDHFK